MLPGLGPAIGVGASLLGGFFGQQKLRPPSAQEQRATAGGLNTAGQLGRLGANTLATGQDQMAAVNQFILPALQGDHGILRSLTERQDNAIKSAGAGTTRAIQEGAASGGVKELALAQQKIAQGSALAQTDNTIRAQAAQTAGSLAGQQINAGFGGIQAGGALFSRIQELLQSGRLSEDQLRQMFDQLNTQQGSAAGNFFFQSLQGLGGGGKGNPALTPGTSPFIAGPPAPSR